MADHGTAVKVDPVPPVVATTYAQPVSGVDYGTVIVVDLPCPDAPLVGQWWPR